MGISFYEKRKLLLILILALLLRLYHVNFPVAGWHSWRQADTAAIARNFYQNGFNLFYPQVDWGGNSPGFVESEFPLYSFLVTLSYAIFGVNDLWGRVLSVVFSIATIYGLYLLARKFISDKVALWTAFIYAILPLNIFYGRAFMPESAILLCSVFGIYFFSEWLDSGRSKDFVLSWLFVSLAILIKIPTLYLGLPLVFLAWNKYGKTTFKIWQIWLLAFLVLLPVVLWYYHAHRIFLQSGLSFGIWGFGTDKWGNFNLLFTAEFYNRVFFKSIAERHLTYAGFIPFLIGLFIKREKRGEKLFDWWLIAVVIYFLIVAKGNQVHEYYQLPFILPAAVFVGKAFAKYLPLNHIRESFKVSRASFSIFSLCLVGIFMLSYFRYSNFVKKETFNSPLFNLASAVKGLTAKNYLVVAVSEGNPVVLYRCERKGWNSSPDQLDPAFLHEKQVLGAKYLIGEKSSFDTGPRQQRLREILQRFTVVKNDKDYFIIKINAE